MAENNKIQNFKSSGNIIVYQVGQMGITGNIVNPISQVIKAEPRPVAFASRVPSSNVRVLTDTIRLHTGGC